MRSVMGGYSRSACWPARARHCARNPPGIRSKPQSPPTPLGGSCRDVAKRDQPLPKEDRRRRLRPWRRGRRLTSLGPRQAGGTRSAGWRHAGVRQGRFRGGGRRCGRRAARPQHAEQARLPGKAAAAEGKARLEPRCVPEGSGAVRARRQDRRLRSGVRAAAGRHFDARSGRRRRGDARLRAARRFEGAHADARRHANGEMDLHVSKLDAALAQ